MGIIKADRISVSFSTVFQFSTMNLLKSTPGASTANLWSTTTRKYSFLWAHFTAAVGNKIKMTKTWNKSLGTILSAEKQCVASWVTKLLQTGSPKPNQVTLREVMSRRWQVVILCLPYSGLEFRRPFCEGKVFFCFAYLLSLLKEKSVLQCLYHPSKSLSTDSSNSIIVLFR